MRLDSCVAQPPRLWFRNEKPVGRFEFELKMFGHAGNLPAIVFAV